MTPDPIQGVLDRQPPLPPRLPLISSGSAGWLGVRPDPMPHWTIPDIRRSPPPPYREWPTSRWHRSDPDSTRRPQTVTAARGRSSQPAGHPHQLGCRRMSETKTGRHPLRKIPSPIRQEQLTPIRLDQPFTSRGQSRRRKTQKMTDPLFDLIIRILPLHAPNVQTACDKFGSETSRSEEKSQKFR